MDRKAGGRSPIRIVAALLVCLAGAFAQSQDELSEGRIEGAVVQLDSFVKDGMSQSKVPGMAIAVIFGNRVFLLNYGVRKVGEPTLIIQDTVFQLASLSKTLTSTVIARLASQR